jgi:hypothetical protein
MEIVLCAAISLQLPIPIRHTHRTSSNNPLNVWTEQVGHQQLDKTRDAMGICDAGRAFQMLKTISRLLVLALLLPSTAMAQPPVPPLNPPVKIRIPLSISSSTEQRPWLGREGVWSATASAKQTTPVVQQSDERSWAGRHPVALGAMIGAAAGALLGAAPCWKEVCGDGHGPLLVAFGAGLGAGVGAGVGLTISAARH